MSTVAEPVKAMAVAPEYELETKALEIRGKLEAVVITDRPSYLGAAELLKASASTRLRIEEFFKPMKDAAFKAHRAVCDREKQMLDGVVTTERKARVAISAYESEQERIRQQKIREAEEAQRREQARLQAIADEENARRRAEAQKIADDERLALAAEIEKQGASAAEIDEVLSAPVNAPEPVFVAPMVSVAPPIPQFQRAAGLTAARKNWKAQVTNVVELAKYVAANPHFANLIQGNQAALDAMAKANENNLSIPGVRAYNASTSVGVRTA